MDHRKMKLARGAMLLAGAALLGGAVMLLWNWIMPGLLAGAGTIDYWHALGLLLLCRILFGGFRGHAAWHERERWQRWHAMTPEEREQFLKNSEQFCRPRFNQHRKKPTPDQE